MSKRSLNTPLTHREVEKLPLGFTPTSFGMTGQQIKRMGRDGYPHTNKKAGKAHRQQWVPIWSRDEYGVKLTDANGNYVPARFKQIFHKNWERIINRIVKDRNKE